MTPAPAAEGADVDDVSVLVIGAGYTGVMATNELLASLSRVEADRVRVTVVNPRPDLVQRIRLHELAAGSQASVAFRWRTPCTAMRASLSGPRVGSTRTPTG